MTATITTGRYTTASGRIDWDPAACQRITSYIVTGKPLDRIEGDTP